MTAAVHHANGTHPAAQDASWRPSGVSSTHFLKLVEDEGRIGFWSQDLESGSGTCTAGINRILGLDPGEALTHEAVLKMMHPEDRVLHDDIAAALRIGMPTDREFRIIRPDGTLRWVQDKTQIVLDPAGKPMRALGVLFDVTQIRDAKRAVGSGWDMYRSLVSQIGVTEWRADHRGLPVFYSEWKKLTGQCPSSASGHGWLDVVHEKDRDAARDAWQNAVAACANAILDFRLQCADGEKRWFHLRAAPIMEADGSVREWIGLLLPAIPSYGLQGRLDSPLEKVTARHIRAARALLHWSLEELAYAARVSVSSVRRLEAGAGYSVRPALIASVRAALEEKGISFRQLDDDDITVSLRAPQGRPR